MLDHVEYFVSSYDNLPEVLRRRPANYYATFVLGPDGHNVETVFHAGSSQT